MKFSQALLIIENDPSKAIRRASWDEGVCIKHIVDNPELQMQKPNGEMFGWSPTAIDWVAEEWEVAGLNILNS